MDYRLDEKGKYYTNHVSKRTAQVLILAQGTLISGTMYLLLDNRVKDEVNSSERFIAITGAEVRELASGRLLSEQQTVILNKDQITWLIPCEDGTDHAGSAPDS